MPTEADDHAFRVTVMRRLAERLCREKGEESTAARLRMAAELRRAAADALDDRVSFARAVDGLSWREIATALGISTQAAHRRYRGYG